MRNTLIFAALLAGCGSSSSGGDVNRGPYQDSMVQLQRLDTSTFIEIAEVRARDDGLVMFCTGVKGLNVVDATDPANMRTKWRIFSSFGSGSYPKCQHVTSAGDFIYMSNRGDETQPTPFVTAFDVSSGEPNELGTYVEPGVTFEGVAAAGDLVFVAMHESGLAVLQRGAGQLLKIGQTTELRNAWSVAVDGDIAFVADGTGGLAVVDISDPEVPVLVSRLAIAGAAIHVELDSARQVAYVSAGQGGVTVVDVSDASAPVRLSQIETPGTSLQVALGAGRAYIADWNDVRVFDMADLAVPVLLATERVESPDDFSRVLGIGAVGDYAFVGEWTGFYSYQYVPERAAPDIWLGERKIEFGRVAVNDVDAVALLVANEGNEPLVVDEVVVTNGPFSMQQSSVTVAPGSTEVLELRFKPTAESLQRGELELRSDDPDEPIRRIELVGNRSGLGIGDEAPDVLVNLLDGGEWRLSEHRGEIVLLAYFATF